jgi:hypothetical protein
MLRTRAIPAVCGAALRQATGLASAHGSVNLLTFGFGFRRAAEREPAMTGWVWDGLLRHACRGSGLPLIPDIPLRRGEQPVRARTRRPDQPILSVDSAMSFANCHLSGNTRSRGAVT